MEVKNLRNIACTALASIILASTGCKDEPLTPTPTEGDLIDIPYNPQPAFIEQQEEFPVMEMPDENPLTVDGIQLGRMLFFDPILSSDSTLSCASCHLPEASFTDRLAVSPGVTGAFGRRSSMALINLGYSNNGLFWDGRSMTLEEQALIPVEDPIELHEDWPNVVEKFRSHPDYPAFFRKAFGIQDRSEITKELAAKAIAQFERTMVVGKGSRFYEVFVQQTDFPTDEELRGYLMFFDAANGDLPDAQCFHCHNRPFFTNNEYLNNGLDEAQSQDDFEDKGRGEVTGNSFDNGRFRTPTLWNVALTAPYMHDGRFETLEEVIDHYASGGHYALNLDPLITDIHLNEEQKKDLLAFLHMLTDTSFTTDPAFQNPFQ
jgi:cytochrome c peroxidase